MKVYFSLILLLILCDVNAQEQPQEKFTLELMISPTYCFRHLAEGEEYFTGENSLFSYDIGALVKAYKTPAFSFSTGLIYSGKGYSWGRYDIEPSNPKLDEIFTFLEIPLRFTFPIRKSEFNIIGGLTNDFLLSHKLRISDYDGDNTLGTIAKARKYNLGILFGFGYDFTLSETIRLGLEPTLKFQTMNHSSSDRFSVRYLYTVGLTVNGKFDFDK